MRKGDCWKDKNLFAAGMFSAIGIPTGDRESIYRYRYRYEVSGTPYEGQSIATQRPWQVGQAVAVEYLAARPCISRIRGAAAGLQFEEKLPQLIVLVILLIAATSITSMTRRRLRRHLLMKNGMARQATANEKKLLSRTRHGREWYQWRGNSRRVAARSRSGLTIPTMSRWESRGPSCTIHAHRARQSCSIGSPR